MLTISLTVQPMFAHCFPSHSGFLRFSTLQQLHDAAPLPIGLRAARTVDVVAKNHGKVATL